MSYKCEIRVDITTDPIDYSHEVTGFILLSLYQMWLLHFLH
jgi:hypothetical protein